MSQRITITLEEAESGINALETEWQITGISTEAEENFQAKLQEVVEKEKGNSHG